MTAHRVLFSVECHLADMEEATSIEAVAGVVLAALRDVDIPVGKVVAEVVE